MKTAYLSAIGNSASKCALIAIAVTLASCLAVIAYPQDILAEPNRYIEPVPQSIDLDARKVSLGEKLFRDPKLSAGNRLSCASCHQLDAGGDDDLARSTTNNGDPDLMNAPTVFNAGLNFRQGWRGEHESLESQAEAALKNPRHGNTNWSEVLPKLISDARYEKAFGAIYGAVTREAVLDAIATYEKSLITPNAPFDRYLRGEEDAVGSAVKQGYALFKDRGCISCHQGRNIGGNMFQRVGIYASLLTDKRTNRGRFNVTRGTEESPVFKVPSLRNVAVTGPYFHDGSIGSLHEAVRVMARLQLGAEFTELEVSNIVAFLESLTGQYRGESLERSRE